MAKNVLNKKDKNIHKIINVSILRKQIWILRFRQVNNSNKEMESKTVTSSLLSY